MRVVRLVGNLGANILNQILGVLEVGENLDKSRVPEVKLIVELHDVGTEENIMKDFMSKRLVPEERVNENIHARDGHEFFCVGCGQMFKFERNLDRPCVVLCGL